MIRIFEMCNQSMPARRPTAVGLRKLVQRKMRRAQKCLGSFEGDAEERMRVRYRKEEFGLEFGGRFKKRRH
jgi:hypothetical protein